jgi:protein phosphatase
MIVELFAKSDVGRVRRGNEDNFLVLDLSTEQTWTGSDNTSPPEKLTRFDLGNKGLVLVVSDGMGGALAGDVASRMAVDSVREMLMSADTVGEEACDPAIDLVECLKNATVYANLAIHLRSQEDSRCAGMGATFTGAAIKGDSLDLVQVGDSRGYVLRKDQIRLATKDQSLVQQLVDVGQISESEAETHMFRNVILQALGAQSEITPVTGRIRLRQGDVVLLCSDGLSGKLRAEDIQHIVVSSNGDLARACDALIEEANNRGGEDNITVVLARFLGDDLEIPNTDRITIELPPLEEDKTLDDSYEVDTEPH